LAHGNDGCTHDIPSQCQNERRCDDAASRDGLK
jgi:hypothetical protein